MLENIYFVNENGQIEVNWESLELITNKEFVEVILDFLNGNVENIVKFNFRKHEHSITVNILDDIGRIGNFRFYPSYSVGTKIFSNFIWLTDLEDLGVL